MQKKLCFIIIFFMFAFSVTHVTYADNLKDKNKKMKNVKNNIGDLKKKIGNVKVKKSEVIDQISKIESQIGRVSTDINKLDGQISATKNTVQVKKDELNHAINAYNSHKDLFMKRVSAMYMNGSSGYLSVLTNSQSFSDLISRSDMVKKVVAFDRNILTDMKIRADNILTKKQELETQQKHLVSLQNNAISKKSELDSANKTKKEYFDKLKQDQIALEKSLSEEEKESKKLESQIRDILAKLAKKNGKGKYSGEKVGIVRAADIGRVPKITSPFGMRYHPILHKNKMHTGIDIGVPSGTPVYAMSSGEVIISEYLSGYGYVVAIDHGGGITSLYAHNSKLLVRVGEKIKKGQNISKSGNTGNSTGPHLHFEVRLNGTPINPEPYLIIGH